MNTSWVNKTPAGQAFPAFIKETPERTLLVFDFDGTLARIVPNPMDARIVEESAQALARLSGAGVQIALISGRPVETLVKLADAKNQPGLAKAIIFGQYGAQRLDLASGEATLPTPPPQVQQAKAALEAVQLRYPGAHLEDKGLSVALHVRNVEDPEKAFGEVEDEVLQIAKDTELTVEPGRFVWELRAATTTKGDALRTLIGELKPIAVAFAGDDLGDLAAFDVLTEQNQRSTADSITTSVASSAETTSAAAEAATATSTAAETAGIAETPVVAEAAEQGLHTCAVVSASAEAPALAERADVLCEGPDGVAAWLRSLADQSL